MAVSFLSGQTRRMSIARVGARVFIGTTWLTRLQVVMMPTVRWHCHSAPSIGLATCVGYAKEIETATTAQVSAATIAARILRFRCPLIAVTPRRLRGQDRASLPIPV